MSAAPVFSAFIVHSFPYFLLSKGGGVPTQYLIHEEGGLERWFNLTITNVGLEAVADYTCVAVNAGGVMEEAITLTFEEPEPVSVSYEWKTYIWTCFMEH